MAHQTPARKETVERVMHEYKHGELKIGGSGPKVRSPKQAIAIALHEAGSTNGESPAENRRNLKRTKAKERRGETAKAEPEGPETRASLYAEATEREIPGRSKMTKEQLKRALAR